MGPFTVSGQPRRCRYDSHPGLDDNRSVGTCLRRVDADAIDDFAGPVAMRPDVRRRFRRDLGSDLRRAPAPRAVSAPAKVQSNKGRRTKRSTGHRPVS